MSEVKVLSYKYLVGIMPQMRSLNTAPFSMKKRLTAKRALLFAPSALWAINPLTLWMKAKSSRLNLKATMTGLKRQGNGCRRPTTP